MRNNKTTEPVQAGDSGNTKPEFGRTRDVERLFGIRKGTLYNLLKQKKIKSALLRVKGEKSGVRLWHLESISQFLHSQMEQPKPPPSDEEFIEEDDDDSWEPF